MKKINVKLFLLSLILGSFVIACGDPIPIQEMALARHEISKARDVKAEKYAPELFKEAGELLMASHTNVKEDKLDDAKKNAELSKKKAEEALLKAVPLIARDTIAIAEESLQLADEAYATELAKDEYEDASSKLETARTDLEAKKFYSAYKGAVEADASAKNARNIAISKKSMLQDAIDEVKTKVSEAKKYGAEQTVPEKLKLAEENLGTAETSLEELKLKQGFAAIEIAKVNADEAYLEALKLSADKNIKEAEKAIADAEKAGAKKIAEEEVNGAKELLSTAKSQYEESQYPESIHSSNEAKRLAGIAVSNVENAAKQKDVADAGDTTDTTDTTDQVETEDAEYDIYTVRYFKNPPKDCLWFIAKRYYKDPFLWKKIYQANRDRIKNPDLIKPGWKLKIPKLKK